VTGRSTTPRTRSGEDVDPSSIGPFLALIADAPALALALVALYELHAMRRAMTAAVTGIARLEGRLEGRLEAPRRMRADTPGAPAA